MLSNVLSSPSNTVDIFDHYLSNLERGTRKKFVRKESRQFQITTLIAMVSAWVMAAEKLVDESPLSYLRVREVLEWDSLKISRQYKLKDFVQHVSDTLLRLTPEEAKNVEQGRPVRVLDGYRATLD